MVASICLLDRFAPNRRTKAGRGKRYIDLQRLKADPGLRADLNNEITSTLTPLPPGTTRRVDDEAATLAEALLSTAARLAPSARRKQGPRGWCAPEEVKAELHTRWLDREDARTRLRVNPSDKNLRKALKAATKQLKCARADVQRFFGEYVSQLEGRIREGDQFGFYKHLKGMDVGGKRTFNSQYIRDEEVGYCGTLDSSDDIG